MELLVGHYITIAVWGGTLAIAGYLWFWRI